MSAARASCKPPPVDVTVQRRDHRHRKLVPHPRRPLGEVDRRALLAPQQRIGVHALAHERGEIEPGAERGAVAREHDCAQRRLAGEPLAGGHQCLEHAAVEAVVLLGSREANLGNPFGELHANAIVHGGVGSTATDPVSTCCAPFFAPISTHERN
jgi:hypothetical protein